MTFSKSQDFLISFKLNFIVTFVEELLPSSSQTIVDTYLPNVFCGTLMQNHLPSQGCNQGPGDLLAKYGP